MSFFDRIADSFSGGGSNNSSDDAGFFDDGGAFEDFFDNTLGLDFDGDSSDGVSGGVANLGDTDGDGIGEFAFTDSASDADRSNIGTGNVGTAARITGVSDNIIDTVVSGDFGSTDQREDIARISGDTSLLSDTQRAAILSSYGTGMTGYDIPGSNFAEVFARAREALGPGQFFNFDGGRYSTFYRGENPEFDAALDRQQAKIAAGATVSDGTLGADDAVRDTVGNKRFLAAPTFAPEVLDSLSDVESTVDYQAIADQNIPGSSSASDLEEMYEYYKPQRGSLSEEERDMILMEGNLARGSNRTLLQDPEPDYATTGPVVTVYEESNPIDYQAIADQNIPGSMSDEDRREMLDYYMRGIVSGVDRMDELGAAELATEGYISKGSNEPQSSNPYADDFYQTQTYSNVAPAPAENIAFDPSLEDEVEGTVLDPSNPPEPAPSVTSVYFPGAAGTTPEPAPEPTIDYQAIADQNIPGSSSASDIDEMLDYYMSDIGELGADELATELNISTGRNEPDSATTDPVDQGTKVATEPELLDPTSEKYVLTSAQLEDSLGSYRNVYKPEDVLDGKVRKGAVPIIEGLAFRDGVYVDNQGRTVEQIIADLRATGEIRPGQEVDLSNMFVPSPVNNELDPADFAIQGDNFADATDLLREAAAEFGTNIEDVVDLSDSDIDGTGAEFLNPYRNPDGSFRGVDEGRGTVIDGKTYIALDEQDGVANAVGEVTTNPEGTQVLTPVTSDIRNQVLEKLNIIEPQATNLVSNAGQGSNLDGVNVTVVPRDEFLAEGGTDLLAAGENDQALLDSGLQLLKRTFGTSTVRKVREDYDAQFGEGSFDALDLDTKNNLVAAQAASDLDIAETQFDSGFDEGDVSDTIDIAGSVDSLSDIEAAADAFDGRTREEIAAEVIEDQQQAGQTSDVRGVPDSVTGPLSAISDPAILRDETGTELGETLDTIGETGTELGETLDTTDPSLLDTTDPSLLDTTDPSLLTGDTSADATTGDVTLTTGDTTGGVAEIGDIDLSTGDVLGGTADATGGTAEATGGIAEATGGIADATIGDVTGGIADATIGDVTGGTADATIGDVTGGIADATVGDVSTGDITLGDVAGGAGGTATVGDVSGGISTIGDVAGGTSTIGDVAGGSVGDIDLTGGSVGDVTGGSVGDLIQTVDTRDTVGDVTGGSVGDIDLTGGTATVGDIDLTGGTATVGDTNIALTTADTVGDVTGGAGGAGGTATIGDTDIDLITTGTVGDVTGGAGGMGGAGGLGGEGGTGIGGEATVGDITVESAPAYDLISVIEADPNYRGTATTAYRPTGIGTLGQGVRPRTAPFYTPYQFSGPRPSVLAPRPGVDQNAPPFTLPMGTYPSGDVMAARTATPRYGFELLPSEELLRYYNLT
jgi:hypothetical protein